MNPVILQRLGPFLEKLMRQNPTVWVRFTTLAKRAGYAVGDSVKDLISYLKSNPVNGTAILALLAQAGASVADLFSPAEKANPDERALANTLEGHYLDSLGLSVEQIGRINDAGKKSEELKGLITNMGDLQMAREVLKWARSHYGTADLAIRAHQWHQAFFEMSREDVTNGFNILDV